MTREEVLALPNGTVVTAVQPCDGVEYSWVRNQTDRIEPANAGGRVLVKRPDIHPDAQHKYLFVVPSQLDIP